jgi:hypothetical protein
MDLPGLLLVIAGGFVVAVIYCAWQSIRLLGIRDDVSGAAVGATATRDTLLEEKEALLRALRDLEMDRDVGKLSARDFERLNQRTRARAREVLRQLDVEIDPYRERARAMIADALRDAERR